MMVKAIMSVHLIGVMPVGSRQPVGDIRAVANSYFGIMGQANAWCERTRMATMLRSYGHVVALQANRMFTERIPL